MPAFAAIHQSQPTFKRAKTMMNLLGFGMPGPFELAIILGILLLLFGSRLPSLMRNLGRGVVEFKKGVNGIEEDIDGAGAVPNDKDV